MKRKIMTGLTAGLLCVCLLLPAASVPVSAASGEMETVTVTNAVSRQTEARKMLAMVNDFRTGEDAWYWNSDDETKTVCTGLKKLSWDYGLEKVAMQRVMELTAFYSHNRPDGESCFTTFRGMYDILRSCSLAENIAVGLNMLDNAEETYYAWREDEENYKGQGHRRAMLSSSYQYIGIACIKVGNCWFWAQSLSNGPTGSAKEEPNDSPREAQVKVDASKLTGVSLRAEPDRLTVKQGTGTALPEVLASFNNMSGYDWISGAVYRVNPGWVPDNSGVYLLSGSGLTGLKKGEGSLMASSLGSSVIIPVSVTQAIIVGDADGDGSVTLQDVSWLFLWWNGRSELKPDPEACDVDGSGTVDLRDAAGIYQSLQN